jgi:hypothetical protein
VRHLIPRLHFSRVSWTLLIVVSRFGFLLLFMCSVVGSATGQNKNAGAPPSAPSATTPKVKPNRAERNAVAGSQKPKRKKTVNPSEGGASVRQQPSDSDLTASELVAPIEVYISWLDKDTVILALSNPSIRRLVVGVAKLSQREGDPESLSEIPGFEEIVSNKQLADFRAALPENGPQNKYKVIRINASPGISVSLDQIDKKFRDYLRSATVESGDLEVWDVSPGAIRVVFVGNLVVVKPALVSTPQSKAEDAMFQLLNKMVLDQKKGIRQISLEGGCASTASILQAVRQEPFSEVVRKQLRIAVTGKMTGTQSDVVNEYIVTNSGWVNRNLNLDLQPAPTPESDFNVTVLVGEKEVSILDQRDLELQPCGVARISIKPQSWFYEFPNALTFNYNENETRLSTTIPAVILSWFMIFAGVAVIAGVGLLIYILVQIITRRRGPKTPWSTIIGSQLPGVVTEKKTYVSEAPSVKRSKLMFWKRAETESSPQVAPPLTAEDLRQQIDLYKAHFEKFVSKIEAALPRLENASQTQERLEKVEAEYERWQETLKELGDSPDLILNDWKTLKQHQETVKDKIVELLSFTGARSDGKDDSTLDSLDTLHREVPRLKGYEDAAAQIAEFVNKKNSDTAIRLEAERVVETVKQLRDFVNKVLRKYAERLQVDDKPDLFSEQSLTELEKSFASTVNAIDMLSSLERDERIHLARFVSARLEKAGGQLDSLATTNPESRSMFDAIGMELTTIAQQLQEASVSLNATLGRVSSRQVQSDNGKTSGQLNTNEVLMAFMSRLLSDKYEPLLNMLRLWQVMEVYCRNSDDPVAAKLHVDSAEFRKNCEQILSFFECLGIHFHKIRFLEKPEEGLVFEEARSVPRLQNNARLYGPIQRRLESSGEYWGTVADVAKWGFKCDLDPDRNSGTMLWLWRKVSTGRSE